MKIAIIGYSGSGKSTLAKRLGEYYSCDVLHLDSVSYAPNWVRRADEEIAEDVKPFLEKDAWIIEGNYSRILYEQRMEDADKIIFFNFNRFSCLWRAYRRYRKYKGTNRPDLASGCNDKFDMGFILWILRDGRSKKAKVRYKIVADTYPNKTVIIKNQRQLDCFEKTLR